MRYENNTYIDEKQLNEGTVEVEVGDIKQPDFYPQVKIKKWNNECNLSFRLAGEYREPTFTECSGVVTWTDGPITARFYDETNEYEDEAVDEPLETEFEIELSEKPIDNTINFTIRHKNVSLFYCPTTLASGSNAPENILGSYEIYHSTKMHNEYGTGKVGHIYRPFAWDADGNFTWCEISIDVENETSTITIPQDFLDNATYPIKIDPTFGYTTRGGSSENINRNQAGGGKFTLSEGGTVSNIKIYCWGEWNGKGTIWDSSGNLVATTTGQSISPGGASWKTWTFSSPPTLSAGTYYLGYVSNGPGNRFYYTHTAGYYWRYDSTNNYNSPQALNVADANNHLMSVYCTYTAAPSGPEPIDTQLHYRKTSTVNINLYNENETFDEYCQVYTESDTQYAELATDGDTDLTIRKGGVTYKFKSEI